MLSLVTARVTSHPASHLPPLRGYRIYRMDIMIGMWSTSMRPPASASCLERNVASWETEVKALGWETRLDGDHPQTYFKRVQCCRRRAMACNERVQI